MVTRVSGAIKVICHIMILCLSVEQNETKMLKKPNQPSSQTTKQTNTPPPPPIKQNKQKTPKPTENQNQRNKKKNKHKQVLVLAIKKKSVPEGGENGQAL